MMRAMLRNMTRFDRLCCVFFFFFSPLSFAVRVGVLMGDSMMLNRFPALRCSGHNIFHRTRKLGERLKIFVLEDPKDTRKRLKVLYCSSSCMQWQYCCKINKTGASLSPVSHTKQVAGHVVRPTQKA